MIFRVCLQIKRRFSGIFFHSDLNINITGEQISIHKKQSGKGFGAGRMRWWRSLYIINKDGIIFKKPTIVPRGKRTVPSRAEICCILLFKQKIRLTQMLIGNRRKWRMYEYIFANIVFLQHDLSWFGHWHSLHWQKSGIKQGIFRTESEPFYLVDCGSLLHHRTW